MCSFHQFRHGHCTTADQIRQKESTIKPLFHLRRRWSHRTARKNRRPPPPPGIRVSSSKRSSRAERLSIANSDSSRSSRAAAAAESRVAQATEQDPPSATTTTSGSQPPALRRRLPFADLLRRCAPSPGLDLTELPAGGAAPPALPGWRSTRSGIPVLGNQVLDPWENIGIFQWSCKP